MKVISKNGAPHYKWGDDCDGWHLVQSDQLSVIQERVPAGCSEVLHLHHKAEQFFFVLTGVATMEVAGELQQIPAQHGIHIPPGVPHKLSNNETTDLSFLVTSTPPSHGDRQILE